MEFTKTETYTYNGEQKEYHYSPTATISEQIAFVEAVSDGVFVSKNCILLLKEPVFNYTLVSAFTDIDVNEIGGIDAFDAFDKQVGLSKKLSKLISPLLYNNLKTSVDANIEYKKSVAHDNISTAIVDLIDTVKNKLETFGEGLDSNTVMDFIQKFGESGINGESIVNAYLNSDQYKENVANVVDSKNADIKERDAQIADLKQKLNDVTAKNVLADKSDKVIPIKGE